MVQYTSSGPDYVEDMSRAQQELLELFSEVYVGSEDNFNEAVKYAQDGYSGGDGFDFDRGLYSGMKSGSGGSMWSYVVASLVTPPTLENPVVDREDEAEQAIIEAAQKWPARNRDGHIVPWVGDRTLYTWSVINSVFAKVQGELFSWTPPESLYWVSFGSLETLVNNESLVGKLVFSSEVDAREEGKEMLSWELGETDEFYIVEVTPGEGTLVNPFGDGERFVLARWGDAGSEVVFENK